MSAREDQARFFGKLAALMAAEVPLLRAMEVALEGVRGAGLRDALQRIMDRAYQGVSLSESFKEEEDVFGLEILTLIGIGEEGGDLEGKAGAIAEGLESDVFDVGREGSAGDDDEAFARLVRQGVDGGASAIHIEPAEEGARIRIRTEEGLREIAVASPERFERILGRCRRRLGVPADAPNGPATGDFVLEGRRIRLSLSPYETGPGIVIHMPAAEREVPDLERLGLTDEQAAAVRGWLSKPDGLVLVAGPRGADRDLVLASLLAVIDRERRKTALLGPPGGLILPGVLRVESAPDDEWASFNALKDQDVDVIGASRLESVADQLVESGALWVAGCSGDDTTSGVARLAAGGTWERNQLAADLRGCVAYRVIPRRAGGDGDAPPFPGRVAVFETLTATPAIRDAISRLDGGDNLREVARGEGLITFESAAAAFVAEGAIAAEDLI